MIKQVFRRILNGISIAIILCALGILLTVVLTPKGEVPSIFGYTLFRVMTGSMEPAIPVDSLIVVHRVEPEKLVVGDVISFFSRDPSLMGEVNTHRIVRIDEEGGGLIFTTKGDANNVVDQYLTREEDVIGKVIFSSGGFGRMIRLISNPLVFLPLIILPLVFILGHSLYESFQIAKKLVQEEEEAAVREAIETIRCNRTKGDGSETELLSGEQGKKENERDR